jgi:hypothetical protein
MISHALSSPAVVSPSADSMAPRHYTNGAYAPGIGLPGDRMARMAARRAFVDLKQTYLLALDDVTDPEAGWLRNQVRLAEEPVDLWLLRGPVFATLSGAEPERRRRRQMLRRGLDSVFADSEPVSHFAPF